MTGFFIVVGVIFFALFMALVSLRNFIYTCAPNEVLIFAGGRRKEGDRLFGYRLIKGGTGYRVPFLETVARMDLTNMVIDVSVANAYSKGGIPLVVHGVANVKIAGHEPVLNNAIERFLGRNRQEVMNIAKATLEGSLRGVLSTMTPEEVNEDKIMFAERLVHEVEADMTSLGLVVDTMKIQNVQDEVGYLDSIGRRLSAEIVSKARIAEAKAKADSVVRSAENLEQEVRAQVAAQINTVKADGQKRLVDATTRRDAVVAEEQSVVTAQVAQVRAELEVQKARVEQVRAKLDADVIQPAKAAAEANEANAKAATASIIEEGRARADALLELAKQWEAAGPSAKDALLVQKIIPIMQGLASMVENTRVERMTLIDGMDSGSGGFNPGKLLAMNEQIKQIFGVDLADKLRGFGGATSAAPATSTAGQIQAAPVLEAQSPATVIPNPPSITDLQTQAEGQSLLETLRKKKRQDRQD